MTHCVADKQCEGAPAVGAGRLMTMRSNAVMYFIVCVIATLACASGSVAQSREPDAEATKAYEALIAAMRARKPFEVKTSLVVEATEQGQAAAAPAVEATLRFDPTASPRRALLSWRGYEILVRDGRLETHHASNEREYVSVEDDGSPYYALLSEFMDLPYPHLGILLGEEEPEDVLPQLNSRAGWIVPTSVEMVEVAEVAEVPEVAPVPAPQADPGQAANPVPAVATKPVPLRKLQRIHLTSDFEHLELDVNPATHAIEAMRLNITGGPMVQTGASLKLTLTCVDTPLSEEESKKYFSFDPGERRRVDSLVALPRAAERGAGGGGGGGGGAEITLVGKPAPDLSFARFDDGDFDLANFKGRKVVVLDFWATWCGPCRVGLPKLDEVARRLTEQGVPVAVAAVNTLEGLEGEDLRRRVSTFWADKNFSMTLALDENGEGADAFGVRALPTTFVIGLDGIVHWQHIGLTENWEAELTAAINAALKPFEGRAAPKAPEENAPEVDDDDAMPVPEP